ncbi:hypothetical protein LTR36_000326 [Oleoguttula mirabilis]|uniref:Beta-lactamase-related domain-containing protein n=1 Tax=Oleoguttula mirabilis TaxID=1507867 RepID=A0AAV9K0A1_9PEZI|nr:hypothetical protein LTR36_000326 [Oleoguttula mirabilis]
MPSSPFTPDLDTVVENALDRFHIPGVSFSVVHGEDTWSKGYGYSQLEPRKDVTPSTLFYAASTSKAHLCAAWAVYIASDTNKQKPKDEQISFSTPLADIIREDFVLSDPIRTTQVTIEDAVSHRTGLPRHELSYGYEDKTTVKGLTRNLRNLPFHNELRAEFEYCNTPFVAASHALETVTGKPLADYLRETLWAPLGMKQTYGGYGEAAQAIKHNNDVLAKGHTWTKLPQDPAEQDGHLEEEGYMDLSEISGAGWAISTADDYAKWMRAWLDPTAHGGKGLLTEDMIKELWKPRSIVPASDHDKTPFDGIMTYGLGWFICTYKGHMLYWHPGGLTGAGSLIVLVPDLKWGVTFFPNGDNGGGKLKGLAVELLDRALGIPEHERTAMQKTDDSVLASYREMANEYDKARSDRFGGHTTAVNRLPLILSIEQYAGTYRNETYGPLRFTTQKSSDGSQDILLCSIDDRTWARTLTLEHVNSHYWFVTMSGMHSPLKTASKAESRVGVGGMVEAIGIAMEASLPDALFWFEKEAPA